MGSPKTPKTPTVWMTLSKLALSVVVISVVSCAPRSNTLRNMAGQMLSPDVYRKDFENFESEDGLFEPSEDTEDLPSPIIRPSRPKPTSHEPVDTNETPEPSAPAPKEPDAAGPALPAPPVPSTPHQPELPNRPNDKQDHGSDPKKKKPHAGPVNGSCLTTETVCFPVAGKTWFTDTYGAARSGHRKHAGNDIFAEKLVPVVAIEDGVVDVVKDGGRLSGAYIGINHGNGVRSLYMHLNNDSPDTNDGNGHGIVPGIIKGVAVKKGQHIGWVGNSGNAETTPPHLHFEIRKARDKNSIRMSDFFPTNPFEMLRKAEPAKIVLPVAHNY